MKIYIPTLARVDKQITWEKLPDFLKETTVLVVQPKEKDLHGDKPILVLPENDIGICKTRKFIYEYANSRNQRYGVFDDDLTFLKRRPKGNRPVKVEMSDDDWRELIETTDKWFDEGISFSALRIGLLPPIPKDFMDNTAAFTAYFFNGQVLPQSSDLDWSIEIGEDAHLILQLFQRGHSNRVWDKFVFHQKEYADGGCNTYRTSKIINDCHQQLIDAHPNYISYNGTRPKKGPFQGVVRVKIKWKQAYLDSQRATLENFIK
tara:strand:- start:624 stop:1409 length:786 start_codon:yes stop_codon:yes gene_type:complete